MSDSDDIEIASKTWNRMANSLKFEGYREGSSAGRDTTFQQGFDLGYEEGFKAAYKLGLHNGILSYLKSDSSRIELSVKTTLSSVEPCENASKGLCVLCVEEEKRVNDSETSDTKSVREIVQLQRQKSQDVESRIFTDEYLAALEQCKMGCLCFLKNNPS